MSSKDGIMRELTIALGSMAYADNDNALKELSVLYGNASVYMAFFLAIEQRINSLPATINYLTPDGKAGVFEPEYISQVIYNFLHDFLRLQVSKKGRGRDDITAILKEGLKSVLYAGEGGTLSVFGQTKDNINSILKRDEK